jgi:alpha-1,6-mannosyltransferase
MLRAIALGVAAAGTAASLLEGSRAPLAPTLVVTLVAYVGLGVLLLTDRDRDAGPSGKAMLTVSGGLLALAVIVPPTQSHDVWAYAMYGRIVSAHHSSPYLHPPTKYPNDPAFHRMDLIWQKTRSVYGPAFTAVSAGATAVVGASSLGARLFFQGLAAIAVALTLWLIWRHTRSPTAVALVGANPLVIISVVNGGHNDALVGLAILGAVLLVGRQRWELAGLCLAGAALVKLTAGLPFLAIAVWVWRRHGLRVAWRMCVVGGVLVAVGYLVAGGRIVLGPLESAQLHNSGASVWNQLRRHLTFQAISEGLRGGVAGHQVRHQLSTVATGAVLGLSGLVVGRRLHHEDPAILAGAAVVAYLLLGFYVLPWYVMWGLPALALAWRSKVTWVAAMHGALLHLAYVPDPRQFPPLGFGKIPLTVVESIRYNFTVYWLPGFELLVVIAIVVTSLRKPRTPAPSYNGTTALLP